MRALESDTDPSHNGNMENTTPFLFDDTDEKFFLAVSGRAIGPLTAQGVYEKLQANEIGLLHYFWRDGWNDWKRICDVRDFAMLIPERPSNASIDAIRDKLEQNRKRKARAASSPVAGEGDQKIHYLYFNETQYGPFSKNELIHVLKGHKLTQSAYLWIPGWANWKRITELDDFAQFITPQAPPVQEINTDREQTRGSEPKLLKKKGSKSLKLERTRDSITKTIGVSLGAEAMGEDRSDKRRAPRRPLVARLFLHNDKDVIIAVCRDISVGGMQVLTDRIPGPVGSVIKLNVSPGDPTKVKSFVAEGEIVRVLEDGRGFSFRFKKLGDEARKTIERYIKGD